MRKIIKYYTLKISLVFCFVFGFVSVSAIVGHNLHRAYYVVKHLRFGYSMVCL